MSGVIPRYETMSMLDHFDDITHTILKAAYTLRELEKPTMQDYQEYVDSLYDNNNLNKNEYKSIKYLIKQLGEIE